jgi:hypothetical protein
VTSEEKQADHPLNDQIDLSMILAAQIIRMLHEAQADKRISLSALGAATSHVQCLDNVSLV